MVPGKNEAKAASPDDSQVDEKIRSGVDERGSFRKRIARVKVGKHSFSALALGQHALRYDPSRS